MVYGKTIKEGNKTTVKKFENKFHHVSQNTSGDSLVADNTACK